MRQPVSVIICAKNEEENLREFLPLILNQDYPDFEVIVVNDCSTDGTANLLAELKQQYPRLEITAINKEPKLTFGKKLAQTVGIKAAKNELLLFTDADCRPVSEHWIESMARNYTGNTEVVLGYGGYISGKGLLDKVLRFDTLFVAIQYLGYALAGIPYMGVGRNLAYKKSTFFKNKGFASHYHISSGDDDLFVNEVAGKHNTKVELSIESQTRSVPSPGWGSWLKQKRRHLTTGSRYKLKHRLLIGVELATRYAFYISFAFLLQWHDYLYYTLGVFGFRLIMVLVVLKLAMRRLKEKDLLLYSPLFDIVMPLIYLVLNIRTHIITKRNRWR